MLMAAPLTQTTTLCEYAQEKSPLTKATESLYSILKEFLDCLQTMTAGLHFFLFVSHYLTKMLMRSSFGTLYCELCLVWT